MENANPLTTPSDTHTLLSVQAGLKGQEVQVPYKETIESLMH
jgi:hypothetical protein